VGFVANDGAMSHASPVKSGTRSSQGQGCRGELDASTCFCPWCCWSTCYDEPTAFDAISNWLGTGLLFSGTMALCFFCEAEIWRGDAESGVVEGNLLCLDHLEACYKQIKVLSFPAPVPAPRLGHSAAVASSPRCGWASTSLQAAAARSGPRCPLSCMENRHPAELSWK
jgi:hypothetical protein